MERDAARDIVVDDDGNTRRLHRGQKRRSAVGLENAGYDVGPETSMEMLIQLTDRGCRKMNGEERSTEEVLQQRIELDREQSQRHQDGLSSQLNEMGRMCEEARKYAMSSLDISKQFIEQTM